ncbi:MAG: hypothetical protein ACM3TS_00130 [Clostridia bacterium]
MMLKSLVLENIRSYKNADSPIDFPEGITLFEGDIGAGKSTLLYAVEFALFGLGEFNGTFLLRNGCSRGLVTLKFEHDGVEYEVCRTLTKSGKMIKQEDCYIKGASGKVNYYSSSDMKEAVLQILNYNEPSDPKAQSLIYRYAIFTPQEEMKEILKIKDSEKRLQILRKAFRIESYRTAVQNSATISTRIRERIQYLSGRTQDVEQKKNLLKKNQAQMKILSGSKAQLEQKQFGLLGQRDDLENKRKKLDRQRQDLEKAQDRLPLLHGQVKEKITGIGKYRDANSVIQAKLREKIEPEIARIQHRKKPTDISLDQLRLKKEDVRKKFETAQEAKRKIREAAARLPLLQKGLLKTQKDIRIEKKEFSDHEKELMRIESGIEKQEKIEKPTAKTEAQLRQEKKEMEQKLKKIESQQSKVEERISNFDKMIDNKKCPVCERAVDSQISDKRSHFRQELEELQNKARAIEIEIADIDALIKELSKYTDAQEELADLRRYEKEIKDKTAKSKKALFDLKRDEIEVIEQIKDAQRVASELPGVEEEISAIDEEKCKIEDLIDAVKIYDQEQTQFERLQAEKKEAGDLFKQQDENIAELGRDKARIEADIQKIETDTKPLKSIVENLASLDDHLKGIVEKLAKLSNEITEVRTLMQNYQDVIVELESELLEKEKEVQKRNTLHDHKAWIDEYFSHAVENIERHIMETIRKRFNEQFQRWFAILIEDPALQVWVNEEFTPEIQRDGYIQDYVALSGGERTSIALSYRIALNSLVYEFAAGGSSDLLILDEPTDGFSKEQLFKLRDILYELRCKQVIIVSHERELQGFASSIYRIENRRGESKVVAYSK